MKKILAGLMTLCLVLGMLPVGAYAANVELERNPFGLAGRIMSLDGAEPESIQETEPNSTEEEANPLSSDCMLVSGSLSQYDLDYFFFALTAEAKVTLLNLATYKGITLGVCDANGDVISVAAYIGDSEGYPISYLEITLQPGTYYLVLT